MTRDRATLISRADTVLERRCRVDRHHVKNVPTIVLDHSRTARAQQLITGFTTHPFFDVSRARLREASCTAIVPSRAQVASRSRRLRPPAAGGEPAHVRS